LLELSTERGCYSHMQHGKFGVWNKFSVFRPSYEQLGCRIIQLISFYQFNYSRLCLFLKIQHSRFGRTQFI